MNGIVYNFSVEERGLAGGCRLHGGESTAEPAENYLPAVGRR